MGNSFHLDDDPKILLVSVSWRATYQDFYNFVENIKEKLSQGEQLIRQSTFQHCWDRQSNFCSFKTQTEKELSACKKVIAKQYYEMIRYETQIKLEYETFLQLECNYNSLSKNVPGVANSLGLIGQILTAKQNLNHYMKLYKEHMCDFALLQESMQEETICYTYQYRSKQLKVINRKDILEKIKKLTSSSQPMQSTATSTKQPTANSSEQPITSSSKQPTANSSEQRTVSSSEQPTANSSEQPTTSSSKQLTVSNKQPTANSSEQRTANSNEQPTANSSEQPITSSSKQPTANSSEQRTVSSSEQPTANRSEQPTTSSSKQLTANSSEQRTANSSEQPTTSSSSKQPTVSSNKQPTTSSSKQPTVSSNKQPTTSSSEQSTASSSKSFIVGARKHKRGPSRVARLVLELESESDSEIECLEWCLNRVPLNQDSELDIIFDKNFKQRKTTNKN